MRVAFVLAILLASLFYTYHAFTGLDFLSAAGRLGPGFFPRLVGSSLVLACLWSLATDLPRAREDDTASEFRPLVGVVAALSALLIVLFGLLGGTLAMGLFLLLALSVLNRGRHLQNLAVAVAVPVAIHLLFDVWLGATMPEGRLPLPS